MEEKDSKEVTQQQNRQILANHLLNFSFSPIQTVGEYHKQRRKQQRSN